MRRRTSGVLIGLAAAGLAIGTTSIPAGASSSIDSSAEPGAAPTEHDAGDNLPNPLARRQIALRMTAMHQVLDGTAKIMQKAGSTVIEVSPGQYVEWQKRVEEESIFTMLVEFGKKTDDRATASGRGR